VKKYDLQNKTKTAKSKGQTEFGLETSCLLVCETQLCKHEAVWDRGLFRGSFFFFKKKKPEKQSEKDLIRLVFKKRLCKQKQDIVKVFSAKRFAFCIFSFVNGNNCSFKKQKFKKKNLHFESKKGYRRNRQVLLLLKGREGWVV
jgi:hypothetical protein